MTSFTELAPAKINLYLHVTDKRDDGYHLLDSLVAFATVGDRVTVKPAQGLTLTITGPYASAVPNGPDNLVLKAANLLAQHAGRAANAHITLEKNLPVASGIGGGSADAAATLRALVKLWALELPDEHIRHAADHVGHDTGTRRALETLFTLWRDDLDEDMMGAIALELGADVPVCLEGRTVFMGGIGEDLHLPPRLPTVWLVLVNCGVAQSTPAVFQARTGDFSAPARFTDSPGDAAELAKVLGARTNDLAAPAIALTPSIQDVLDAVQGLDGCLLARMSGSGATCFGLFATKETAESAAQNLRGDHPDWWVKAGKISDDTPVF